MKTCSKCQIEKPFTEFNKRNDGQSSDGVRHKCKDCYSFARIYEKYKLTEVEYKQMLADQNGGCKICFKTESTKDGRYGRTRTLSVDHCHKTGKIRGLLCENCNRALGLLNDSEELIQRSSLYLRGTL